MTSAHYLLFWSFGGVALLAALFMVFTRNVLYAALALVTCMVALAGVFVVFNAEYLAVTQILVYAGGVIVLLAFGIMLTTRDVKGVPLSSQHLWLPAVILFTSFGYLLYSLKYSGSHGTDSEMSSSQGLIGQLGESFMTTYLLPFEVIAFLLLVVLVGAAIFSKDQKV